MAAIEYFRSGVEWLGELSVFTGNTIRSWSGFHRRTGIFIQQCETIGISSIGILSVAAIFVGAVMGYQLYQAFALFGAQALVGGTIGVSIFREFAPVFGSIMVTGRAGAAIGAEIASMRISEQIDALEVMGIDPYEYLVLPRVLAGAAMMPILAFFFGGIACLSAAGIACGVEGLSSSIFWKQLSTWTDHIELIHCGLKSISFGIALTLMGSFYGFRAEGGARSVGYSARTTVVMTCLGILLLDYFWTMVLPMRTYLLSLN